MTQPLAPLTVTPAPPRWDEWEAWGWAGDRRLEHPVTQTALFNWALSCPAALPEVIAALAADPSWVAHWQQHAYDFLMLQAIPEFPQAIPALLAAGLPVNAYVMEGWTPLLLAAQYGSVEAVQALLAGGADVNLAHATDEQTPLMEAAGCPDMVAVLIAAGANVHAATETSGTTALVRAACLRHGSGSVAHLLAAGADPNQTDLDGFDAMTSAVVWTDAVHPVDHAAAIVRQLLEAGADSTQAARKAAQRGLASLLAVMAEAPLFLGDSPDNEEQALRAVANGAAVDWLDARAAARALEAVVGAQGKAGGRTRF